VSRRMGLTPQALLTEMLLDAQNLEGLVVIALLKDGKVRTAWSDMPQVHRIGAIEAARLESAEVWRTSPSQQQEES